MLDWKRYQGHLLKQGDNSYSVSYDAVGNATAQQRWVAEGGSSNFMLKTIGQAAYPLRRHVTLTRYAAIST